MSSQMGASPGGPAVSSAKKRRLAALEERFGKAEAAGPGPSSIAQQQQQQAEAGPTRARAGFQGRSPADGQLAQGKGQSQQLFGGPSIDVGVPEFPYLPLAPGVCEGPLHQLLQGTHRQAVGAPSSLADPPSLDDLLEQLLRTNPRAAADVRAVIASRLQDKTLLLDNPTLLTAAQAFKRENKSAYSAGLRRGASARRSPQAVLQGVTHEALQALNVIWMQYAQGVLFPQGGSAAAKAGALTVPQRGGLPPVQLPDERRMLQLELHGARVAVVRAADVRHAGKSGLVAMVTRTAVVLMTPDDRIAVVPKQGSEFRVALPGPIPGLTATLIGDKMPY